MDDLSGFGEIGPNGITLPEKVEHWPGFWLEQFNEMCGRTTVVAYQDEPECVRKQREVCVRQAIEHHIRDWASRARVISP